MFERLIDLIIQLWDKASPGFIVDAYQDAGVLRFGRYNRTCAPGFHWKIPFVEKAIEITTCLTTMRLPPQTLTTADGKVVVVTAIVRYRVRDVKPFITDIFDQQDALADVAMGAIRAAVREHAHEELVANPPEDKIATKVRRTVNKYGFEIEAVTFADLAQVRSFRLISALPLDINN
jgi:regulator of protease activity HflC (stomatin/prohibitin superfamily)